MVEAHRIADPGSGEGVFPINKTLIQTQPVRQDLPLHIAFAYSYSLYFTTYCRRATTSSKLLVPNFFRCLGGEERREQGGSE